MTKWCRCRDEISMPMPKQDTNAETRCQFRDGCQCRDGIISMPRQDVNDETKMPMTRPRCRFRDMMSILGQDANDEKGSKIPMPMTRRDDSDVETGRDNRCPTRRDNQCPTIRFRCRDETISMSRWSKLILKWGPKWAPIPRPQKWQNDRTIKWSKGRRTFLFLRYRLASNSNSWVGIGERRFWHVLMILRVWNEPQMMRWKS